VSGRLGFVFAVAVAVVTTGCNSSHHPNVDGSLAYTNPTTGTLQLVKDKTATPTSMVLDLIVGTMAVTGYSTGFDLPLDMTKVSLGSFTPGTALSPGSSPSAARAALPTTGPLTGNLVVAQSQKAAGTGAVTTDTTLPPGTVLFTVELNYIAGAADGVVFDGTAPAFALPSGGLLDRAGDSVVGPANIGIGKLEVVD
jgi:hypothetical protein